MNWRRAGILPGLLAQLVLIAFLSGGFALLVFQIDALSPFLELSTTNQPLPCSLIRNFLSGPNRNWDQSPPWDSQIDFVWRLPPSWPAISLGLFFDANHLLPQLGRRSAVRGLCLNDSIGYIAEFTFLLVRVLYTGTFQLAYCFGSRRRHVFPIIVSISLCWQETELIWAFTKR